MLTDADTLATCLAIMAILIFGAIAIWIACTKLEP